MGNIREPEKAKLIAGVFSASESLIHKVKEMLEERFGPIDYESPLFLFDQTDYYKKEMGQNLLKCFFSFRDLIEQEDIAPIKLTTNSFEERFIKEGKRQVNIDPGFVNSGKLVLATTKDQQQRILISNGIYAEVTLRFIHGTFTTWEWTYRDYQTPEYIHTFNHIRELFRQQTCDN